MNKMINQAAKLAENLFSKKIAQLPTRDGYGEGLVELGEKNEQVVVLTADLAESTRAKAFGDKFPQRFFEMGVAEQNMMGVAAGLALAGKIPFVSSYAVFSPGRSWDQARVSVAYSEANVKIAGAHTGVSVGPDGATHQALEDLAIMRVLPNMTVVAPADAIETKKCTLAAAELSGPVYFRFARDKTPVFTTEETPFEIGKAIVLREGKDVALIACGPLVYQALLAAEELAAEGIEALVINSHTIKPLDEKAIVAAAQKTGAVVTIEEHQVTGGLGGAVAETLAQKQPTLMRIIGMPDTFGESGEPQELLEKFGLSASHIAEEARQLYRQK